MRTLAFLLTVTVAGCAGAPADPPSTAAAVDKATSAAEQPAPAAAAGSESTSPVKGASAVGGGGTGRYHIIERDGVKFYCTDKPALGTRVKSRSTCMSEDQYLAAQQSAKDKMREKQGQRQSFE